MEGKGMGGALFCPPTFNILPPPMSTINTIQCNTKFWNAHNVCQLADSEARRLTIRVASTL